MEHQNDGDTNCNWSTWNGSQRFGKEAGRIEKKMARGDYLHDSIFKIS